MGFSFRYTIKQQLTVLLTCLIAISLLSLAASFYSLFKVENQWSEFQTSLESRNNYLSEIRKNIGFGGMIHNFKNYVLRGDIKYQRRVEKNYTEIRQLLNQYRSLSEVTPEELTALENISQVIDKYQQHLAVVAQSVATGNTPDGIDAEVKIDDSPALQAFDSLNQEIDKLSDYEHAKLLDSLEFGFWSQIILVMIGVSSLIFGTLLLLLPIRKALLTLSGKIAARLPDEKSHADRSELYKLNSGFTTLFNSFDKLLLLVGDSSSQIAAGAAEQQLVVSQASEKVIHQQREITEFATAMNEMSSTIQDVAGNTSVVASQVEDVRELANIGSQRMQDTATLIRGLSEELLNSSEVIGLLEENSQQISAILDVITGISDQTNLLALNAAIEAARAGEHGRGFAVVADEVRHLAAQTGESTHSIRATIEQLQQRVNSVVENIQQSVANANHCVQEVVESEHQMEQIAGLMDTTASMALQIATATEQQGAVSEDMNKNITEINASANATHSAIEQVESSAIAINDFVKSLYQQAASINIASSNYHISMAKMAHQLWVGRMIDVMSGKQTLQQGEGQSHTACELGKWYLGEGLTRYADIKGMQELDEPHRQFHVEITKIVEAHNRGDRQAAEQHFEQLVIRSKQVCDLLGVIEQNIAKQDAKLGANAA